MTEHVLSICSTDAGEEMKTVLTLSMLQQEAHSFAAMESRHNEASLYGVTDGKAVGTYLEHKFQRHLRSQYEYAEGSSAKGIDFPQLGVDLKVTSVRQPQSSCPFRAARQKVYGLGYALLVFVYEKTDDERSRTGNLNIRHVIFIESSSTADFQTTTGIRRILDNAGNVDDIIAFLMDRFLPVDEIKPKNSQKKSCKIRRRPAILLFPMPSSGGSNTGEQLIWLAKWAALPGSFEMKTAAQTQFGDFQTPIALACQVTQFLKANGASPSAVVEPTCGVGSFLLASMRTFGGGIPHHGFDVNPDHIDTARDALARQGGGRYELACENFYDKDWPAFFRTLPEGLLIVGNPPWVTNAALGSMRSNNHPEKRNFQGLPGFAAKTGRANFDISEWMLIKLLESLRGRQATLAMLCKTATARRVLRHAWNHGFDVRDASLHGMDVKQSFGVSVDACLFVTHTGGERHEQTARVYSDFHFARPVATFGIYRGELIADIEAFGSIEDIDGVEYRKWRSGVKHDAAKVMELKPDGNGWVNGLGERYWLEPTYLFPLLKSSDLANDRLQPSKYVLLTQRQVTDDTSCIRLHAPETWCYLLTHGDALDRRRSSIYARRPRFAVFGVGPYTFSPWKVAISGLYKTPVFRVVGSVNGAPIVLDDTCYFIPCETQEEAVFFCSMLNSDMAKTFIRSLVFFDAKRPITIDLLKRIDLKKLAAGMNLGAKAASYLTDAVFEAGQQPFLVFESEPAYGTDVTPTDASG